MKNVCESCGNRKQKGGSIYCLKYGIIVYEPRIYCVAYERGLKNEQVHGDQDGD